MLLNPQEKKDARILVVDDSATNRALLRAILKNGGYQVEEAEDGNQCIEHCERETPSIILLDVMMPKVDGLTACRKLREGHTKAELPIIMVTTMAETKGLEESLAAGANDYVMKPIDRATLLARMENQLAWARAQKQIEEQSRALEKALRVQSATGDVLPEAVVVHDHDGNIVYANRTCLQFCGGSHVGTMAELCSSIFGGKYADALLDCYQNARERKEFEYSRELLHSQSPYHTVFVLTKPIGIEEGGLRLWLWRDDTAQSELERSVNQRIKLETVGLFAAGVAHNFNNIMGAVLGATDVLERITKDNDRGQRCVNLIKKAVDSGKALTRKMSSVYGKDALPIAGEGNGAPAVIDSIIECYEQVGKERIVFERQYPSNLPSSIMPGRVLVEIFGNVLSNAVESIEGSGVVRVSGKFIPDRACLEFRIVDSGRGMSADELQKIYEPFFSTKNFDKLSGVAVEGRGLGMWNTYNLITSYRGSLTVESALGEGTTVTIVIPAVS